MLPAGCLRSCCVVLFLSPFSKSLSSVTSTAQFTWFGNQFNVFFGI